MKRLSIVSIVLVALVGSAVGLVAAESETFTGITPAANSSARPRPATVGGSKDAMSFYVATNGSDDADGSAARPFRTLGRAQRAVREVVAKGLTADVKVYLRGGTYYLNDTLAFTAADSGTPDHSITWQNYKTEIVRISGGKKIEAQWKQYKGDLWACSLPTVADKSWQFRDLFANGKRKLRSRWPNVPTDVLPWARDPDQHLHPDHAAFAVVSGLSEDKKHITLNKTVPGAAAGQDIEIVHLKYWIENRTRVVDLDGASITTATPVGLQKAWYTELILKDRVFLENAEQFIDMPGEWALRPDGTLLYMRSSGEDLRTVEFIAPRLTTLLKVRGSESRRVTNLHFRGLIFEHANWHLPQDGYHPVQATFSALKVEDETTVPISAAIECVYVDKFSFENSVLRHTGANGLYLGEGSRNSAIKNSEFYDIGGNAVMAGDPIMRNEADPRTANITIENNAIHDAGKVMFGAVGVWGAFIKGINISHNEIYDLPYTAISAGWVWGPQPSNQRDCHIRYNYIHDIMRYMTDGAGVYMLGMQPHSDVSHNVVKDVLNGNGLYADQGSRGLVFYGNAVENVGFGNAVENMGHSFYQHLDTSSNLITNNIFIRSKNETFGRREPKPLHALTMTISKNIIVTDSCRDFYNQDSNEWTRRDEYAVDKNCYYRTDNGKANFGGKSVDKWLESGNDGNSLIQVDPLFEDNTHAGKNYRLRADSPCLRAPVDFKQIDVQKAGRYEVQE